MQYTDFKMLIGGALIGGGTMMDVIDPATAEPFAICPCADEAQLNAAVAAAQEAFPGWSSTEMKTRQALVTRLADAVDSHAEELAHLLTREQGKPLNEAHWELSMTAAFYRQFATMDLPTKLIEDGPERRVEEHRKALGVVGLIVPWNFPLLLLAFKLPPALLAGNTVIVKPAPTTPLATLRLGEMFAELLPPGVLNIVADHGDLGPLLTSHPDVAKISLTGSTQTGKKVMLSAANTLKHLTLELGGNDAGIVLENVDPVKIAPAIFQAAFMNCGQVCVALKRLYVHEAVHDALCSALSGIADSATVDSGLVPNAQFGPVHNKAQFEKIKGLIEDSRLSGTIVAGGQIIDRPGYFIRPTIVKDVRNGTRIVDEEQFGPVLPIIKYSEFNVAIVSANDSDNGLGASVWSNDIDDAVSIARQLEAGTIWINTHGMLDPNIAFNGTKHSGIGVELGQAGLEEYTQRVIVNINKLM